MASKVKVISALTILLSQVGIAPTALAHEATLAEEQCQALLISGNRTTIREQLELLLAKDPYDHCIPFMVSLLGGSPLAFVVNSEDHDDDFDRGSNSGGVGEVIDLFDPY